MRANWMQDAGFLAGGGEMGERMRAHDWSGSPLGSPTDWPQSLRSVVGLLLGSKFPMFVAWGPELGFLYNDSYAEILGAKHPDALGRRFYDIWSEIWPDISPLIDAALAGDASYHENLPLLMNRRGFDEQTWFTFSYSPVRDESGQVAGMFCACAETTSQVLAEAALRQDEARLSFLDRLGAETAPLGDADAVLGTTTRLLGEHLNLAVCAYADMDEDQDGFTIRGDWAAPGSTSIVGHYRLADFGKLAVKNLSAGLPLVINDNLRELAPEEAATFQSIGIAATICMPLVKKGRLTALMAIHDRVPRIWTDAELSLLREVTARSWAHVERVRARAALRELNETLEAQVAERTQERDRAWKLSQDLLVVAAQDGTITAVNEAWTALLGWEPEELKGKPFADFTHPDDLPATLAAFAGIFEEPLTIPFEYRFRHKDGSYRWFAWTGAFEQGSVYASGRHTTAEREQAEALAEIQDALRQSQKMEAVGQLTGGIAHDFNNMLAVVIGSLDLLGRRIGSGDARAKRYVDAATDGARRAALLTQRLLAFSRQQPLRPEPVDVNKLVTGMSDLLRGALGSDIRFETVLAGGGWRTHADPNQLENVLLNLAVNARDAMPHGGKLTVETQNTHLDARYAAAHIGVPAGQYVLIAVSDTGAGMPGEVIAKAFDPFFTTKDVGKGTGLGLSQVYGFVKQSGGHVKIYSEPGQGTTVKVYLPRLPGSEHGDVEVESATELPLGESQEVVLVVEDEAAVRQFSVDALVELGYRVLEADGAAGALKVLEAHPEIALMFTDVVMPDVNGRKLADEARRRRPDLKVLFTTGYTRNAVVHNGVLEPGVDLIGKPFNLEELAAKVREVLDGPTPE